MKKNLISKFVTLVALSLLITTNIFALDFEPTSGKAISTAVSNWQNYNICEDSLRASFPVSPAKETKAVNSGYGKTSLVSQYMAISGHSIYTVSCTEFPTDTEKLSSEQKKFVYEFMMKEFEQAMEQEMALNGLKVKVKLLPLRETTADGRSAFEQDYTMSGQTGTVKFFMYGKYGILALTFGSSVKDRNAFLNSFAVIPDKGK